MKRKTFDTLRRSILITSTIIIIVGAFYIYFKSSIFAITSYELVGVQDMYKDTIEKNLRSVSSQNFYRIIPGDKILSFKSKDIKQSIVSVLPNTQTVILRPIGLHTLRVKVIPYVPLFKIDEFHGITKEGVIYPEFKDMRMLSTIYFASSTSVEIVKDGIKSNIVTGIESNKLTNLSKLISKIDSVIFKVSKIEVDEYGDISFYDERLISRIMFSGTTDTEKVWSNLVSAIDTDPLKSKLENNKDKLEYLDTRFGNKVFFKFTNDSKTVIIQSHATTTASTTFFR